MKTRWIPLLAALAACIAGCGSGDDHSVSSAEVKGSNQKIGQSIDNLNVPDSVKQQMKAHAAGGQGGMSPGMAAAESAAKANGQKIPNEGRQF